jgi:hypothetical protein
MKITVLTSKVDALPNKKFPGMSAELQELLNQQFNQVSDNDFLPRHVDLTTGIWMFTPDFYYFGLASCESIVNDLEGDVEGAPYYAIIAFMGASMPSILNPREIPEYDEEGEQTGTHTETWRECQTPRRWNLSEQEDESGYFPLTLGSYPPVKGEVALTMAEATDLAMPLVESIPQT